MGSSFIALLKYLVVPLVLSSLVSGIVSVGNLNSLSDMGLKTIVFFVSTTVVASIIGICCAIGLNPGEGFIYKDLSVSGVAEKISLNELYSSILPTNIVGFISGENMLFVIALSVVLGCVILIGGKRLSFPWKELFDGLNSFMMIITSWIIRVSPIGIFGLIAEMLVSMGAVAMIPLIKYMAAVIIGLLIYSLIILPIFLMSVMKCAPIDIFRHVFASLSTGFSTASSAATLPILMEEARTHLKIPNKVSSFVLPLGVTINMDGTAIFQSIAVIFIAQIYGVPLSIITYALIVLLVIVSSVAAAAVPSAGLITIAIILTTLGIPIEGAAIIMGIDRILDMIRTTVNLWSNTIAAMILTKWFGVKSYE